MSSQAPPSGDVAAQLAALQQAILAGTQELGELEGRLAALEALGAGDAVAALTTSTAPSGPAGGDLEGFYPNPTIALAKLRGPWENLVPGPKIEQGPLQVAAVRSDDGANFAELRGDLKVKAGEEVKTGEVIATVAAALRPPAEVAISCNAGALAGQLAVTAAGVMKSTVTLVAGTLIPLDGLGYNLT